MCVCARVCARVCVVVKTRHLSTSLASLLKLSHPNGIIHQATNQKPAFRAVMGAFPMIPGRNAEPIPLIRGVERDQCSRAWRSQGRAGPGEEG